MVPSWNLSRSSCLLAAVLMLMVSGCFAPRSLTPLKVDATDEIAAILPITPGQVRFVLDVPDTSEQTKVQYSEYWVGGHATVVRYTNAILDTLASQKSSKLIGPTRVERTLEGTTDAERLHVCLNDPGPLTESWKQEIFAEIGGKLGVERIVVVKPVVEIAPLYTGGEAGVGVVSWDGNVTVKVELVGLSPLQLIATHTGQADFWGVWGAVGGYAAAMPFALGKGLDRALDQATRQALSELLATSVQRPNVP